MRRLAAQREPVATQPTAAEPPVASVPQQDDLTQEQPTTTTAPSSQPAAAVVPPATTQPAEAPPPIPDYLKVLELYDDTEPAYVEISITSPRRMVIETRNVRKIHIDRKRLPMNTRHNIILRLDGQGIEWTAKSKTEEFERSINGDWSPLAIGESPEICPTTDCPYVSRGGIKLAAALDHFGRDVTSR